MVLLYMRPTLTKILLKMVMGTLVGIQVARRSSQHGSILISSCISESRSQDLRFNGDIHDLEDLERDGEMRIGEM